MYFLFVMYQSKSCKTIPRMSSFFGIKKLPYKMVKMYDTAGKECLMLKEKMPKNVNKRSAFIVRLESNENASETYRLTEDLFLEIKKKN